MDTGECDLAIISDDFWFNARLGTDTHCSTKIRLTETVTTIANGVPIGYEFALSMSTLVEQHKSDEKYSELAAIAKANYTTGASYNYPSS